MSEKSWNSPAGRRARVLCLGGGSICSALMDPLLGMGCGVAVVDRDRRCQVAERCQVRTLDEDIWAEGRPSLVLGEAITTAEEILDRSEIDLLVPSIPGHAMGRLAMAWSGGRLSPRGSTAVLDSLNSALSGRGLAAMDPENGTLVCTLNTGPVRCPADCPQGEVCPITGRPRELDMDQVLKGLIGQLSLKGLVIRPMRLGNYGVITDGQLKEVRALLNGLEEGDAVAIATSCACHGIMNTFKVRYGDGGEGRGHGGQ